MVGKILQFLFASIKITMKLPKYFLYINKVVARHHLKTYWKYTIGRIYTIGCTDYWESWSKGVFSLQYIWCKFWYVLLIHCKIIFSHKTFSVNQLANENVFELWWAFINKNILLLKTFNLFPNISFLNKSIRNTFGIFIYDIMFCVFIVIDLQYWFPEIII